MKHPKLTLALVLVLVVAGFALAQSVNVTVNTGAFTVSTNQALGLNWVLREHNRWWTNQFTITDNGDGTFTTNFNAALTRQEFVRLRLTNALESYYAQRQEALNKRNEITSLLRNSSDETSDEVLVLVQRYISANPSARSNAFLALP